jgi:hypothetical protein
MQPHGPALGTDNLHGPPRGRGRQDHLLKTHSRIPGTALLLQPFAQGGEADPVTGGKVLSGQLTLVKARQQSLPLLRSQTSANRSIY